MSVTQIVFCFLSLLALLSAVQVIRVKSPVHSVLYLIITFFAISGHYVLLNAQFLAVVNIIVYAGAIMVLFLFVVMLMNLNADAEPIKHKTMQFAGVFAGGALFLVLIAAIKKANLVTQQVEQVNGGGGLIKTLGNVLFKEYVLPFEISSILFLSAMIGAVVLAKKD
jgi:NADH-quinone oxidoreductase subunit J